MKGLAEFVMRGRLQALLVVVVGAGSLLFCWISAAVLALVTLRKGVGEGAWLLLWALLPAGTLLYVYGDSGPLVLLAGVMVLALILRTAVSLPLAILGSVPIGILTGLALHLFSGQYLDQIVTRFGEFLGTLEQGLSQGAEQVVLARPDVGQIAGMLGAGNAMTAVLCLLLARYWQSELYNPGGFGREFKALYYPPVPTAALALAALVLVAMGMQYRTWAMICVIPLTFAGLALVHARADQRGRGLGWLIGFYVAWLLLDPVKIVVVGVAIVDSWINFRQRWFPPRGTDVDGRDNED